VANIKRLNQGAGKASRGWHFEVLGGATYMVRNGYRAAVCDDAAHAKDFCSTCYTAGAVAVAS
jgi:hypothetical protein